jgi:hypothetical protein
LKDSLCSPSYGLRKNLGILKNSHHPIPFLIVPTYTYTVFKVASSEVNSYNIDNSKRIFPSSGMIDRASAEISKCIMRLKRKDAKKPPEIPPKPANIINNSGGANNGHNHNNHGNSFQQQQQQPRNAFQQQQSQQESSGGTILENGASCAGGSISTGSSSSYQTNKHGGIAVLPHHITTLNSIISCSAAAVGVGNGGGGGGGGSGLIGGPSSSSSIGASPTTPRKFPTLTKKTPKHKKLLSHHSQLWNDEDFLKAFFSKYFSGSERLVLPMICRKWRDVTYGMGRAFWGDLIPVLKCKELRGVRPDLCAGIRRRFYGGLVKRG